MLGLQNVRQVLVVVGLTVLYPGVNAPALDEVPEYYVTRMGDLIAEQFPGAELSVSQSRALNENGDLVGEVWISTQKRAWIYSVEHGIVPLPLLPDLPSNQALDVSDRDADGNVAVVGAGLSSVYSDAGTAGLWRFSTVSGEILETRVVGALPGYSQSILVAVNNDGIAVGYSQTGAPGLAPMKYDMAGGVLELLEFPSTPADLNNLGQVVGGRYRGDLEGNVEDLGVPPNCTSVSLKGLNDLAWATGRAGRPFTDGAGHFMVSQVRYTDNGWHVLQAFSHLDSANAINIHGDTAGDIGISGALRSVLYIAALGQLHLLEDLVAPEFFNEVFPTYANAINDAGQIGAYSGDAVLLTPLGQMIIPGDVDGNAQVAPDDLCAWLLDPIDLNGDGAVDVADEQWLIDRLAVFGFTVSDCNANATADHCDIAFGFSQDCDENTVPDDCQPDCSADGVPDACEPDCNANGNADPCDITDGLSQDCNGNDIPDECDQGGQTQAVNLFDPPVELLAPDVFVDGLLITDAGVVEDVDFSIDIDYRIGDLTVLLSHGDITITLIDRPGYPETSLGNGQLGYDIVLDDEGTGGPIEDEGNFGSPFEPITSPPSYTPDETLSTFDGMASEGLWTVTVMTTPSWSPVSSFNDWGLTVTRGAVPVEPCACYGNGINNDGVIDAVDLAALLGDWGTCCGCDADLNDDCDVGAEDLALLLGSWGPCP